MVLIKRLHLTSLRRNFLIFKKNKSTSSAEYCMNLVKSHDYENFISALLLDKNARSCAFAVRSFNVEVARIAEQVSLKETGLMRMQFWEDAVNNCYENDFSKVPKHPVAIELFKAIQRHKLPKRTIKNLISCRKEHLGFTGFQSLDEMEKYLEKSVSSVYFLILQGCDVQDINADHAASHLGKAQGIVQQLKSVPFSKQLNFLPLPQALLVKNKISHEEVLRCKSSQSLNDCVFEVASRAHQHLMTARKLKDKVPLNARSAFLPAVAIFSYLDKLQKVDYDVFHPSLARRQWNLLFHIWFAKMRNGY